MESRKYTSAVANIESVNGSYDIAENYRQSAKQLRVEVMFIEIDSNDDMRNILARFSTSRCLRSQ